MHDSEGLGKSPKVGVGKFPPLLVPISFNMLTIVIFNIPRYMN
jgi:hypothetical protein